MLTFKQFVSELASEDVSLSAAEVAEMTARFGKKVLQMGHIGEDGTMLVPVDCIVEAAHSLGARTLTEAAEVLNNEQIVSMLQSGETLVERVIEAREQRLREAIRIFQNERDAGRSHEQWKRIEKEVFGVDYND
jgi:hypothetical protein